MLDHHQVELATPLLLISLSPPRLSGQAGVAWLGAVALDRCVARERTTQRRTPSGPGLDNTDHSLSVARLSKPYLYQDRKGSDLLLCAKLLFLAAACSLSERRKSRRPQLV